MGIETYDNNIYQEAVDPFTVAVIGGAVITLTATLGAGAYVGKKFKDAMKCFPKIHPDCVPFDELDKKSYKLDIDKTPNYKKELKGKLAELSRTLGNRADVYSYKNKVYFTIVYTYSSGYYSSLSTIKVIPSHKDAKKYNKYYLLCACVRYAVYDSTVYEYAVDVYEEYKAFKKRPKENSKNQGRFNMESTIERLNEVKEFLESKEEDVDKKIEKAKESAENINKKETRGFISKKQAKEDLENLEDRIDDLKDKVGKNRKENNDKKDKKEDKKEEE